MDYIKKLFDNMGFTVHQVEPIVHEPMTETYAIDTISGRTFFKWIVAEYNLEFFLNIKDRLKAILLKGVRFEKQAYDYERLQLFVDNHYPILSPEDKLDRVLEFIQGQTSFEGQRIQLKYLTDEEANMIYFANSREWQFYLDTAVHLGFVKQIDLTSQAQGTWFHLSISGLTRLLRVKERNESKVCFVAMSFDTEMVSVYENAIAPAIRHCKFEPYIVNRIMDIPSDVTINDAILAGIKKARFTIADFTSHKGGIYFEAGYALGRGQKVIYTCNARDISKSHFDTRNYQHIVWTDVNDLKNKLVDKIEAFIID